MELVGQLVQPPGVSTTLDETEQVEPICLLKRSMVVVSLLSLEEHLSLTDSRRHSRAWPVLRHVPSPANSMLD